MDREQGSRNRHFDDFPAACDNLGLWILTQHWSGNLGAALDLDTTLVLSISRHDPRGSAPRGSKISMGPAFVVQKICSTLTVVCFPCGTKAGGYTAPLRGFSGAFRILFQADVHSSASDSGQVVCHASVRSAGFSLCPTCAFYSLTS